MHIANYLQKTAAVMGGIAVLVSVQAKDPVIQAKTHQTYPVNAEIKDSAFPGNLPTGAKDFTIDVPRKNPLILDAAEFGVSEHSKDNTDALNRAFLEAGKRKAGILKLKKNKYFFTGELHLYNAKDLIFDANGSDFIFRQDEKPRMFLHVADSRRIQIINLNFDWDWENEPLAVMAKVKETNPSKGYIDFYIREFENRKDLQKPLRIFAVDPINPVTFRMDVPGGYSHYPEVRPNKNIKREWLPGTVFRYHDKQTANWFKNGADVRLRIPNERRCGILFTGNKHMTIRNVNIYSTQGGAIVANGEQQYWSLENVNIKPPDNSGRCMSSIADPLHFSESQGYFKMENCDFSLAGDDCVNIHDFPAMAVRIDDHTLKIRKPDSNWLKIGDTITLRHDDFSEAEFSGKIVSVTRENPKSRFYFVKFTEKVPQQTTSRFIAYNQRFGSHNILIRNCKFHENRARGLLLQSNDVTVENCQIRMASTSGLHITSGYFTLFDEGYGAKNIVLKNNVFDTNNLQKLTIIDGFTCDNYIGLLREKVPLGADAKGYILQDILFQNNRFINSQGLLLHASSAKNIFFIDNTIEFVGKQPEKPLDYVGSVYMRNVDGIYFRGNKFSGFSKTKPFFAFKNDCRNRNISKNSLK